MKFLTGQDVATSAASIVADAARPDPCVATVKGNEVAKATIRSTDGVEFEAFVYEDGGDLTLHIETKDALYREVTGKWDYKNHIIDGPRAFTLRSNWDDGCKAEFDAAQGAIVRKLILDTARELKGRLEVSFVPDDGLPF